MSISVAQGFLLMLAILVTAAVTTVSAIWVAKRIEGQGDRDEGRPKV